MKKLVLIAVIFVLPFLALGCSNASADGKKGNATSGTATTCTCGHDHDAPAQKAPVDETKPVEASETTQAN